MLLDDAWIELYLWSYLRVELLSGLCHDVLGFRLLVDVRVFQRDDSQDI